MGDPYCRDKSGDIVCGNCDAGIGDEVEYAHREGVIEGLTWARHRASTVYDVERIQAEIERLRAEQKEGCAP